MVTISAASGVQLQVTTTEVCIGVAGEELVVKCTVNVVEHLIVQWSGGSVGGSGVIESNTTHSGTFSMRTLTFTHLNISHGADYTCQAEISIYHLLA